MKPKILCPICCGIEMQLVDKIVGYMAYAEYYKCPKCGQKLTIHFGLDWMRVQYTEATHDNAD